LIAERLFETKDYLGRAVEVFIHIGLVILLAATCFLILSPFVPLIAWGIIVAIAVYPSYQKLQTALGGRGVLSAVVVTLLLLAVLIVPVVLLAKTLIGSVQTLAEQLKNGTLVIPPPPTSIESWPVIGAPLKSAWSLASTNLEAAVSNFGPQIKTIVPKLLSASAGIGFTVLQFALSIVVAGAVLGNCRGATDAANSLASRLLGERGPEFEQLACSTIRSVTTGILGVAVIQSVLASLGFLVVGLPGAGLWAIVFLIAAILQVGTLVLVPAVIYIFATASITKAVIFLVWCLIVALMDNVLKPLLLGRGVAVPIAVVFLGAIGGFVAMGIIGLFVGATVLSVGYKLFLAWLDRGSDTQLADSKKLRTAE
jgi:predicted PurR-regulated permease PerM